MLTELNRMQKNGRHGSKEQFYVCAPNERNERAGWRADTLHSHTHTHSTVLNVRNNAIHN